MVRYVGMDVHREFAQLAVVEDGLVRDEGRIGVTPEALRAWADTLQADDQVALEATGNSDAIAMLLTPLVARVVVSNPSKTRVIAEAKVKTDKVDARILAQLLAADFLPPVWLPDDQTRSLRRQVTRRAHLVRQRTRIKNQVHAILARNLAPTPPVSDLFGKAGRHWLLTQPLPADEQSTVHALLRQLDFHGQELAVVDRELAVVAFADPRVARLMTIPGVDAIAGVSIVAAVGDFARFGDPDRLVAYVGLNPKVRQSGNSAPMHGRISKAGRAPGPWCAGRGRLVRQPGTRTVTGLLPTHQGPPRLPDRDRRNRPEDGRAGLAPDHQGRGLRVCTTEPGRAQTPHARTRCRCAVAARQSRHPTRRLQRQAKTPRREEDRRTGRAVLPGLRRPLATQTTWPEPHTGLTITSVEQMTFRISTS